MEKRRLIVIGASNVDISATSAAPLVQGDSNPGHVRTGLGGVGRNIAENLTRLGHDVRLLAAYGADGFAERALAHAVQIGLDCSLSPRFPDGASGVYVCVNGPNGDMAVAVNDMAICARITPQVIMERLVSINAADAVILDANLPEDTIEAIAQDCVKPLFADAVSTLKASRLRPVLLKLSGLKVNRLELEALSGLSVAGQADVPVAANKLHALGVRTVLVTLGELGAFASDGVRYVFANPYTPLIRNATGCGDAFTAAAVAAILGGCPLETVLDYGLACAGICGQSEEAVSPELTIATLAQWLQRTRR
jgi:pseudouridine kinase